jgi:hypothetical protein
MPDGGLPGGRKTSTSPRKTLPSNNGMLLTRPTPESEAAMAVKLGFWWWPGDWREGTGEYELVHVWSEVRSYGLYYGLAGWRWGQDGKLTAHQCRRLSLYIGHIVFGIIKTGYLWRFRQIHVMKVIKIPAKI